MSVLFVFSVVRCGTIAFDKCYATLVQIIWGHFNTNVFTNVDPDACLAHFAANGCQNFVPVFQTYAEHGVGQFILYRAVEYNYIIFCHKLSYVFTEIFFGIYDIILQK